MKEITIQVPEGKKAEWIDGILTLVDDVPKSITERIKTYEDAWKELGYKEDPLAYDDDPIINEDDKDIIAYKKLRIIVLALNEGWKPQFAKDEYRWYSYFRLYTQEEIDEMPEGEKSQLYTWGGSANNGSYSGLGFVFSFFGFSFATTNYGSRLALKSEELATYCGKQFIDIWKEFIID